MTDRKTVHEFDDSGTAYDACQCDEAIKTGDMLVVHESRWLEEPQVTANGGWAPTKITELPAVDIVALAWAWPVAVTVEHGHLHTIQDDADSYQRVIADAGFTTEQIAAAVAKAHELKAPVRPLFEALLK